MSAWPIKFLGGVHAFTPEQLEEALRAASGAVVETYGDPSTPEPSEVEKTALRDVLDALGLVRPDDPRHPAGGRTVSDLRPSRD